MRHFETSSLTDVAQTLSEVTERLAQATAELVATRREEWVDAEGARLHLKRGKKRFERIATRSLSFISFSDVCFKHCRSQLG